MGASLWRYEYAVMNHDFDRRIKSLTMQVPLGATVSDMTFHDVDRDPTSDWLRSTSPGWLAWNAPVRLSVEETPGGELTIEILGPSIP